MAKINPLKVIGIIIIGIGAMIIITALPLVQQTVFEVGPIKTDIPPISAIRIIVGFVLGLFGLVVYFGKEGLKVIK